MKNCMKRASVSDLRTRFPLLARWLDNGEPIEITRRGQVIALLSPAAARARAGKLKKPDILKRLRAIYGDLVLPEEESRAILDESKSG
jgi:antitoxin (DNA-binding transcriptional repressor) of toxin-antitoxin stability system